MTVSPFLHRLLGILLPRELRRLPRRCMMYEMHYFIDLLIFILSGAFQPHRFQDVILIIILFTLMRYITFLWIHSFTIFQF